MTEHRRLRKTNSKSNAMTLVRLRLFGEPLLLDGEDAAAYDEFLARTHAAVKPVDSIDEMLINDVAALEWEVLRWRRLKLGLIQATARRVLKDFLSANLDYELYKQQFADELTEDLEEAGEAEAQALAHNCVVREETDAVAKVREILARDDRDLDIFKEDVRDEKVKELIEKFARGEPEAIRVIRECLAGAGKSVDSLIAGAVTEKLEHIERIDRLTTIAETRRNAALREIDRRRAILGETLRRAVQEIEHAEYELIEAKPAKTEK
jgi:hypothetical protein